MAVADYITGYQHIGIPTQEMEETTKFYTTLGFHMIYETQNNGMVRFFSCRDILIETYEKEEVTKERGAIDHIALAVNDIDKATEEIRREGLKIVEGPTFLNFWENGVKYVCVEGPNKEIVEFLQKY